MSAALTLEQIPGTKQGNEQWTEVVIDRLLAGDSIPDVADEYDSTPSHVRNLAAAYNHALATVDAALTAERERVLADLRQLVDEVPVDCEEWLTPLRNFAANPQKDTDQ